MSRLTFTITTLGCKVNQYESEAIAQALKGDGWISSSGHEPSELYIVNTCAVTQKASMQSRQAIRQAIRSNPGAKIVVTGCYAQTEPEAIKKISDIHHIIGHADKHRIPEMFGGADPTDRSSDPGTVSSDMEQERCFKQMPGTASGSRTRPFLKIQDGCDAFCTFCIVPYARGRSRSMPAAAVLQNIRQLEGAGYKEVVLSGIHLGCYGQDLSPKTRLADLLRHILSSCAIDRVRLSSIEPCELTDEILSIAAESNRICHHFHVPLQSGDDLILKKMHRPYTDAFYRELILKIRKQIPDAAIGADILIGFPGETPQAFENTYSLIKELPVTYLHVFPFSPRKATPASRYPDPVSSKTIKSRCRQMRELGNRKKLEFYEKFLGRPMKVLVEGRHDRASQMLKGVTSNYLPVLVRGTDALKNTFVTARINTINIDYTLSGTLCEQTVP